MGEGPNNARMQATRWAPRIEWHLANDALMVGGVTASCPWPHCSSHPLGVHRMIYYGREMYADANINLLLNLSK